MGQIVKLIKLVERLDELDEEEIIFAREPWTEDSDAMVVPDPDPDPDEEPVPYQIPPEATAAGMVYFLEVFIAREVVEGWTASLDEKPTLAATCRRLIEYATNDA
jgi:hypothetical protein